MCLSFVFFSQPLSSDPQRKLAKRQKERESGEETRQTEIGREVEIQLQRVTGLKPVRLLTTFLSHRTQGPADSLAGKYPSYTFSFAWLQVHVLILRVLLLSARNT